MDHDLGPNCLPSLNRFMFMSDLCHEKARLCQFDDGPMQSGLCANAQLNLDVSIVDLNSLCTV